MRFLLGEEECALLDELYRAYHHSLLLHSFSLFDCRPEHLQTAEDCVQETFIIAIRRMARLKRHPEPVRFLMSTCHKVTVSRRRKLFNRRRILHQPLPLDEQAAAEIMRDDIAEWMLREDWEWMLQQLNEALTDTERSACRTRYAEGCSVAETAERLGLTEGAARGALQRVRAKARRLRLAAYPDDEGGEADER